jgi:hypothetical protein
VVSSFPAAPGLVLPAVAPAAALGPGPVVARLPAGPTAWVARLLGPAALAAAPAGKAPLTEPAGMAPEWAPVWTGSPKALAATASDSVWAGTESPMASAGRA